MFTGIVQRVGSVRSVLDRGGDAEMVFAVGADFLEGVQLGDSIAVNGCCLTVTRLSVDAFSADVSRESLEVTTLKAWHAFHLTDSAAPFLSQRFAAANFDFRARTMSGIAEQSERWKRAICRLTSRSNCSLAAWS